MVAGSQRLTSKIPELYLSFINLGFASGLTAFCRFCALICVIDVLTLEDGQQKNDG